ncbi:hypothetical protein JCM14720_21440 [Calditerricola yamamurae]
MEDQFARAVRGLAEPRCVCPGALAGARRGSGVYELTVSHCVRRIGKAERGAGNKRDRGRFASRSVVLTAATKGRHYEPMYRA